MITTTTSEDLEGSCKLSTPKKGKTLSLGFLKTENDKDTPETISKI